MMFISQLFWEDACLFGIGFSMRHWDFFFFFFHWEEFVGVQLYKLDHAAVTISKYQAFYFTSHSKLAPGLGSFPGS